MNEHDTQLYFENENSFLDLMRIGLQKIATLTQSNTDETANILQIAECLNNACFRQKKALVLHQLETAAMDI